MRIKALLIPMLLLVLTSMPVVAQQLPKPLSVGDLFVLLWGLREHKITQEEIVRQVDHRGIDFTPDEETLSEMERQGAGPRLVNSIRLAGERLNSPEGRNRPVRRLNIPGRLGPARQEGEIPAGLPLIEQARLHALEYTRALPNFIVSEQVERYIQSPRTHGWKLQDTLQVELSYRTDTGEQFKLLSIDGAPTHKTYAEIGGSTSTGEFGSILAGLFIPRTEASFQEIGREQFHGRQTAVYAFQVKTAHSLSQISDKNTGRTIVSGYEGRLWIDVHNGRVLRIEQSHNDIPPGFPVTLAENAVEYDWVTIAGRKYLMPVRAEVLLGEDQRSFYARNVIRFRDYHKFEVDVRIRPD